MIMYSLHNSQHYAPELVDQREALAVIESMRQEGTVIHTATFSGRDGRPVTAFWTTDNAGAVATLWEYSYAFFTFNAPPTVGQVHESDEVTRERDLIRFDHKVETGTVDTYSVGE